MKCAHFIILPAFALGSSGRAARGLAGLFTYRFNAKLFC